LLETLAREVCARWSSGLKALLNFIHLNEPHRGCSGINAKGGERVGLRLLLRDTKITKLFQILSVHVEKHS
jgi:hypothetical protein